MATSPTEQRSSDKLDGPPPLPKSAGKRASLMDAAGPNLGADASNPQIMSLQGLQLTERGVQMLMAGLPQLQPLLADFLAQLRQIVPQAMSGNPGGLGAQPPTGAMPMMTPPPGAGAPPPGPPQQ